MRLGRSRWLANAFWSAVTCHRFGRLADLSAKQRGAEAALEQKVAREVGAVAVHRTDATQEKPDRTGQFLKIAHRNPLERHVGQFHGDVDRQRRHARRQARRQRHNLRPFLLSRIHISLSGCSKSSLLLRIALEQVVAIEQGTEMAHGQAYFLWHT